MLPRACRAVLTLAALLLAFPAFAQTSPESAEELFVRARALMKANDCVTALPLLEQSHALDPKLGTRLNLAICEARLGKLTQAAGHLRSVVDASVPADNRRVYAERALRELEPRIPKLIVELDVARQTLETVRLDGELPSGLQANEPFAINPGQHEVEVVLARQERQVRRFSVSERQTYTWSLSSVGTAVGMTGVGPQDAAARGNGDSGARHDVEPSAPPSIWTTQRKAAVVAGGVSLASFGVATGFALSARATYASSDSACDENDVCNLEGVEARDRAREKGRIATVALTVGVASVLAAGTLWIVGEPRSADSSRSVRVGVHSRGIVVEGRY